MAKSSQSNGLGLGTVLFLIFMTLKLTKTIDWSWWWVTAPLWIPIVLILGALAIAFFGVIIAAAIKNRK
jgi:hypothetical protein